MLGLPSRRLSSVRCFGFKVTRKQARFITSERLTRWVEGSVTPHGKSGDSAKESSIPVFLDW